MSCPIIPVDRARINNVHTKLFIRGHNATLDSSPSNKTITNTGGVSVVDAPGGHPYAMSAGYFAGGTSDFLSIDAITNNVDPGTQDFVIEGQFYATDVTSNFGIFSNDIAVQLYGGITISGGGGQLSCTLSSNGTSADIFTYGDSISANAHHHWRLVRSGNTYSFYVDGVRWTTVTSTLSPRVSANYTNWGNARFIGGTSYRFIGYMVDCCIRIGTDGGYGGATTPVPTAPLVADSYTKLLLRFDQFQDQVAKDASGTGKALTFGSNLKLAMQNGGRVLNCDGSTSSDIRTQSSDYVVGTGDVCIEGFATLNTLNNQQSIFQLTTGYYVGTPTGLGLGFTSGNVVLTANGTTVSTACSITLGTEFYWTVVRYGGYTRVYINNTRYFNVADSSNYTGSYLVVGGYYVDTTQFCWMGYIRGFRLSNIDRGYTGASITAPTYLSNDANTKLLVVPGSDPKSFLDSSPTPKTITRNGNAIQTILPVGKKELNFVGSSTQKLTTTSVDFNQLKEFTIETYYTHNATNAAIGLLSQEVYTVGKNGNWFLDANTPSTGNILFRSYDGQANQQDVTGGALVLGCTYHICVMLKNGVCWIHINGIPVASTSSYKNIGTGGPVILGHDGINTYLYGKQSAARLTAYNRWTPGKPFVPPRRF